MKQTTLCFPVIGSPISKILLGYKKIGFGAGKYTGFGGKIEAAETAVVAAARELWEETGLEVIAQRLPPAGVLTFVFPHRPSWSQHVHLFVTRAWAGDPVESNEMRPAWFDVNAIPYAEMWDDGRYWMPPLLAGEVLHATFTFAEDNQTVVSVSGLSEQS